MFLKPRVALINNTVPASILLLQIRIVIQEACSQMAIAFVSFEDFTEGHIISIGDWFSVRKAFGRKYHQCQVRQI